jgi:CheY-like chemotaxis protein
VKVLIVEDEDPKLASLLDYVSDRRPTWTVATARSVRAATESVKIWRPDFLLLDMSLPTFDIKEGEPGGRPQGFGGIEVLRYLDRMELPIAVAVVTGYEAFTKDGQHIDLTELSKELAKDFSASFKGAVQFNSVSGEWVNDLTRLISRLYGD